MCYQNLKYTPRSISSNVIDTPIYHKTYIHNSLIVTLSGSIIDRQLSKIWMSPPTI